MIAPQKPVVALIGNDDFSMAHFRSGLISELIARGYDVVVFVPDGAYVARLRALGARVEIIAIKRFISPLSDLALIFDLTQRLRRERPIVVHTMTIKPNIFGTLAARMAGVRRVVGLVSGAGYIFSPSARASEALSKALSRFLYAMAMRLSARVWFQNADDVDEFVARGIIPREKCVVIRGSGVDTEKFAPGAVPAESILALRDELAIPAGNNLVVLVAARMIWSKGIGAFFEAAKRNAVARPDWSFVLLAPQDEGTYDSVAPSVYRALTLPNLVVVDKFRHDVERFVAMADIVTLPSYYREGVPRSLIEAMAMAKPIVAADAIGTRETVIEGRNGILVAPRDDDAFCTAVASLMDDAPRRAMMGAQSRALALEEFDERKVVARVLGELYGFDANAGNAKCAA